MQKSMFVEILEIIANSGADGIGFPGLLESIKSLSKNNSADWTKLRVMLFAMIEDSLVEERYFADGKVDYSIQSKGIDILKKLGL